MQIVQCYKHSAQAMDASNPEHARGLRTVADRYEQSDRNGKSGIILDISYKFGISFFVKLVVLPVVALLALEGAGSLAGIPVWEVTADGQIKDHQIVPDGEGGGTALIDDDQDGLVDQIQPVVSNGPGDWESTGPAEDLVSGTGLGVMGDAAGQRVSGAFEWLSNFI